MNYPRIFFIFGLIVVLIPFLGIPLVWKHILTVAVGISIVLFAILLRSALRAAKKAFHSITTNPSTTAPVEQRRPTRTRSPKVSKPIMMTESVHEATSQESEQAEPPVIIKELEISHDES